MLTAPVSKDTRQGKQPPCKEIIGTIKVPFSLLYHRSHLPQIFTTQRQPALIKSESKTSIDPFEAEVCNGNGI